MLTTTLMPPADTLTAYDLKFGTYSAFKDSLGHLDLNPLCSKTTLNSEYFVLIFTSKGPSRWSISCWLSPNTHAEISSKFGNRTQHLESK